MKYNHSIQDLYTLIKNTPEYIIPPHKKLTKVERFLESLSPTELKELEQKTLQMIDTYDKINSDFN